MEGVNPITLVRTVAHQRSSYPLYLFQESFGKKGISRVSGSGWEQPFKFVIDVS